MYDSKQSLSFLGVDEDIVKLSSLKSDLDNIISFLEYALDGNIVYYEALVSHDSLVELISILKSKDIGDYVLELSKSEFWSIYAMYDMHKSMKDEYDDFPESFENMLLSLGAANKEVFPESAVIVGGGA